MPPSRSRGSKHGWRPPDWSIMPLTALATVLVLLVIMLPVYFVTKAADDQQSEPQTWPTGMTEDELELLVKDQININFEIVSIRPEEHEALAVFSIHPGGRYHDWDELGVLQLPDAGDGGMLIINVGVQKAIKISDGDEIDDKVVDYILTPIVRLFQYPFDVYEIEVLMDATTLDVPAGEDGVSLPVGVVYAGGRSGWKVTETFSAQEDLDASLGVYIVVRMQRSDAVKFCAILIMIFMWTISLAMFSVSLHSMLFVTASNDCAPSYDVPALSVGLLFALPFVRSVMPDVPDVGIACDVLGFFWNVILVAAATVMTMGNILHKHRRAADIWRAASRHESAELAEGESSTGGAVGSLKAQAQPQVSLAKPRHATSTVVPVNSNP